MSDAIVLLPRGDEVKRETVVRALVFCALVGLAASVRLVSEAPNFNAVTAAALFAGFYFRSRVTAMLVPLLAMVTSDIWLGGYDTTMMAAVYVAMCVPIAWRTILRNRLSPVSVGSGAVCSSLTHFALTNLAVWYAWYPHTWDEMAHCYAIAVPFLANSLTSDLLFSTCFFGLYAAVVQFRPAPVPQLAAEGA